ncbi:UDP-glycosyltransferase UGT5 [Anabrus simplex]|uniref:UDP-glycosyltransferase UGT5 n=1 Tax=Anabrus simplex TaxID=316456 RepID=UPI0035A2DFFF
MGRCCILFCAIVLALTATESDAARILGLFHYNGRSHFVMFEALLKGLAAKGHDVTVVSHFPQKKKLPNYTDLSLEGSLPRLVNNFTVDTVRSFGHLKLMDFMWNTNLDYCKIVLDHPVMQNMMKTKEKFDVIITEIYAIDCSYGFSYKFNIPIIGMISSVSTPWANAAVGNPDNPSYIPNYFLSYRPQMSFTDRLTNMLFHAFTSGTEYILGNLRTDKLLREYFGPDMPALLELTRRTSLVFVNSHFSINQPRPAVPAFVEVGGLHIPQPKKLPKDIENFLNGAEHGAIYFSFGSLVKGETLPKDKLHAFVEAFRKVPQRVIWKIDGAAISDLPQNIKTSTWLPQLDILSHPNVRLFISHGGLMGSQEAVYTGVPLLGIPLFADQYQNIKSLAHTGMALKLDYDEINEETFSKALDTVLNDHSYQEKAKHLSQLFRDRPHSAMETAIFWTEYIIRHGGAPHLRSAAVDMPLYQYLLLDVLLVLLLGVGIVIATLWFSIRMLLTFILFGKVSKVRMESKKRE